MENKEKKKKMPKKLFIILLIVCTVLLLCAILFVCLLPNIQLAEAKAYYEDGEYDLCLSILENHHESEEAFSLYKQVLFKTCEVGSTIYLGTFEQDNNLLNGSENIEWLILEKDTKNNRILVISKEILFSSPMTANEGCDNTWENTTLREYLNSDFYTSSFDESEKTRIVCSEVRASFNPEYQRIETGNDTSDYVFLLSLSEANSYMTTTPKQLAKPTAYAKANGCNIGDEGYAWWWLRTNGYTEDSYGYVSGIYYDFWDNRVNFGGNSISKIDGGVRPCMWLQLQDDEGQGE